METESKEKVVFRFRRSEHISLLHTLILQITMKRQSLFTLSTLVFLCHLTFAAQSDFLIITNPDKLSILNQYEQPLTESEKKLIFPFMPFQIINPKEILGDQITEVTRCTNLGSTYFLLKNESGGFTGNEHITFQKISKCIILGDTVEVIRDFTLSQKFPSKGIESTIKKGESCIRIFQNGSNTYLLGLGKPQRYGWCTTSGVLKKAIKIEQPEATVDFGYIAQRIQKRLDAANELYRNYFSYFNTLTHQQKSIPCWQFFAENGSYRCTLKGSQQTIVQLQQSTDYIVQDIEQLLLGKPFSINNSGNLITIVKR
jgi:hypothetical protein